MLKQPTELESAIERRVVTWAKGKGIMVTKMNLVGARGMPDRCFWLPGGKVALIEFKRPGAKPTPLQDRTIQRLKELGYLVSVQCDSREAIVWLCQILEWPLMPNVR